MIEYADYIGFAAGVIFGSSGLVQAFKIFKLKGGESISVLNYAMMITGMSLWSVYALMHGAWMFVVWNTLAIILQFVVIGLTIYYSRKKYYLQPKYERRHERR